MNSVLAPEGVSTSGIGSSPFPVAARARERGVSLSSLLTEFARRASRADAANPDVGAEEREWEEVLGDGFA